MSRASVALTDDPLVTHELRDPDARSVVRVAPARGGMVTHFSVDGAPVLYLDEASLRDPSKNVRGGVPLLFPIAGRLADDAYARDGARLAMKQHGFARNLPWRVAGQRADVGGARLTLALDDDAATRAQYPWRFRCEVEYALSGVTLTVTLRVTNLDAAPMPVQPGTHPYFHVARDTKAGVTVDTDATRAWNNVARREEALAGPPRFGEGEVDLHLLDHASHGTVLHRPGARDVALTWSDNHAVLVVWTLPDKDFVCVEPWSAPADALNTGRATQVQPGATEAWWLSMRAL